MLFVLLAIGFIFLIALWVFSFISFYFKFVSASGRAQVLKTNDNKLAATWLAQDLKKAEKEIKILSGYGDYNVYNNEEVKKAFEEAVKKKVKIDVLIGPKIEKLNENYLAELTKDKKISMYKLPINPEVHYRIVDDSYIFMEKPHAPNAPSREVIRAGQGAPDLRAHLINQFTFLKTRSKKVEEPQEELESLETNNAGGV